MGMVGHVCESWSGSGTTRDSYRERDSVVVRVQRTVLGLPIEKGTMYGLARVGKDMKM